MRQAATVLLVEDEPNASERVRAALASTPSLRICGVAGSLAEARRLLARSMPDVLVTDLGLPDGNGIELIRGVARCESSTLCLVHTVFADDQSVFDALEAGALGYLLKDESADELRRCTLELLAGGSPMSPSIARKVLGRFRAPRGAGEKPSLSAREREVLELIVKGFKYHEIARLLDVGAATVATHAQHIYRKLAVHSRSEAAYEAAQLGLVDLKS